MWNIYICKNTSVTHSFRSKSFFQLLYLSISTFPTSLKKNLCETLKRFSSYRNSTFRYEIAIKKLKEVYNVLQNPT